MTAAVAATHPYRLIAPLGRGGMAEVWLAEGRSGERVALKRAPENAPPGAVDALAREAAIGRRLAHPGIVRLLDAGRDGSGSPYLAFEYIDGPSLRERLANGALGEAEVVALGSALLDALSYAHARGVIHNDIKPENILLGPGGPRVADFGAAQSLTETVGPEQARELTATLAYLAPEVLQGAAPSPQSDLYSLALTLYEAAAGRLPFTGTSAAAIAGQRLAGGVPPLRRFAPAASPRLERTLARALDPNPGRRFAEASAFAGALDARHEATALVTPALLAGGGVRGGALPGRGPRRAAAAMLGALGAAGLLAAALAAGAFDRGGGTPAEELQGQGGPPNIAPIAVVTATATSTPEPPAPTATPTAAPARTEPPAESNGDGNDKEKPAKPAKPGNGRRNFAPGISAAGPLEAVNSLLDALRRR